MSVKINFKTNNAAFEDFSKGPEIARILRRIADEIESDGASYGSVDIRDLNGNKVGTYSAS